MRFRDSSFIQVATPVADLHPTFRPLRLFIAWCGAAAALFADSASDFADAIVSESVAYSSVAGYIVRLNRPDGTFTILASAVRVSAMPLRLVGSSSGTYRVDPGPHDDAFVDTRTDSGRTASVGWTRGDNHSYFQFPGTDSATTRSLQIAPRRANSGAANVSVRLRSGPQTPATVGFVIPETRRWVLVRAVGPGLAAFQVPDVAPSTEMTLYKGAQKILPVMESGTDIDYREGFAAVADVIGAFPLPSDSKDAMLLAWLQPGAYTVQARSPQEAGELLVEVYVLPYGR